MGDERCAVIDLDGVVYAGGQLLPGVGPALQKLAASGRAFGYATNTSGRTAGEVRAKLLRLGAPCAQHQLVTSGAAAAKRIADDAIDGGHGVFVIGTDSLRAELVALGVDIADPLACGAVLVGLDPAFCYATITAGIQALARDVPFVICNRDASYPGDGGELLPGCGAMVGAIEAATGRRSDLEIGKPSTGLLSMLASQLGVQPGRCLVIGDCADADVAMAAAAGVPSVYVTRGRSNHHNATFTVNDLPEFVEQWLNGSLMAP